jgi:hypothetical protein
VLPALAACSRQLMPTPNLCADSDVNPFSLVAPAHQSNEVNLLYATDREPDTRKGSPG